MSECEFVEEGDHEMLIVSLLRQSHGEADLERRGDMSSNLLRRFRGRSVGISIIVRMKAQKDLHSLLYFDFHDHPEYQLYRSGAKGSLL